MYIPNQIAIGSIPDAAYDAGKYIDIIRPSRCVNEDGTAGSAEAVQWLGGTEHIGPHSLLWCPKSEKEDGDKHQVV